MPDIKSIKNDKGIDWEVCQCSGCGLVQLNTPPVPYYREVIRASAVSAKMKAFRRKQFNNFVKKYFLQKKKIIEIGCGKGEFLSIMQKFVPRAYGLEYSKESVAYCVKNGLKVFPGFVESADYKLNNTPFDAFFILNFLEHLPEPNSVLQGIYNNLTDDGIGLVEVPNFDMILQKKLFSEFIGDHLFYFTRETLNSTLGLNGFEIIDCKVEWYDYVMSAVVRPVRNHPRKSGKVKYGKETGIAQFSNGVKKKRKTDLSDFKNHQAKLKKEIEKYLSIFKNKKVAIWGASHQALAIISLLNLSGKIEYVIDSAMFKQGKFTPATHIPIVAPDKLYSDPVDAIIVMAAGYSDEVAGIIRRKFDKRINISILRDFGLEIIKN
ncbi:MAG: methyltransferase domain-containing protein [Syntrophaceae bacterium]|nr:methyltransferase domain-containing protein [Syntrophaceae bacterium]